jgi:hypothetical protein
MAKRHDPHVTQRTNDGTIAIDRSAEFAPISLAGAFQILPRHQGRNPARAATGSGNSLSPPCKILTKQVEIRIETRALGNDDTWKLDVVDYLEP